MCVCVNRGVPTTDNNFYGCHGSSFWLPDKLRTAWIAEDRLRTIWGVPEDYMSGTWGLPEEYVPYFKPQNKIMYSVWFKKLQIQESFGSIVLHENKTIPNLDSSC